MKVKDLIKELKRYPPEFEVIMSKDEEGNNYSPWDGEVYDGMYIPECTWAGEWYTEQDMEEESIDEEKFKKNAVVLYPIN